MAGYSEDFKKQAVARAEALGNVTQAAHEVGVSRSTLAAWIKKYQDQSNTDVVRLRRDIEARLASVNLDPDQAQDDAAVTKAVTFKEAPSVIGPVLGVCAGVLAVVAAIVFIKQILQLVYLVLGVLALASLVAGFFEKKYWAVAIGLILCMMPIRAFMDRLEPPQVSEVPIGQAEHGVPSVQQPNHTPEPTPQAEPVVEPETIESTAESTDVKLSIENAIPILQEIARLYGGQLHETSKIMPVAQYIKKSDSSGFTKTRNPRSYSVSAGVLTKGNTKQELWSIAYAYYKLLYEHREELLISYVEIFFQNSNRGLGQVTLGRHALLLYFSANDNGPEHFYKWLEKRVVYEPQYIEDVVVASSPGYVDSRSPQDWVLARGNIKQGVILYYGQQEEKMLVGTVTEIRDRVYQPITNEIFKGVKIRYPRGNEEWKLFDAISTGPWYVKRSDPALGR